MKKVLIITDSYPPIAGPRIAYLVKFLPNEGWKPSVLRATSFLHMLTIRGSSFKAADYELNFVATDEPGFFDRIRYYLKPDLTRPYGFFSSLSKIVKSILERQQFDAILSSSPMQHFSIHAVASKISKQYNIPWICDIRDIPEQIELPQHVSFREKIIIKRMAIRRKALIKNANYVTTISEWHQDLLLKENKKTILIYNGFDPEFISTENQIQEKFTITYTGSLVDLSYGCNPKILLKALDNLINTGQIDEKTISVNFYTKNEDEVKEFKKMIQHSAIIHLHPYVLYNELPMVWSNSTLLLVLSYNGGHGILTTKFFEYIATRKPIILTPPDDGSLINLIQKYKLGKVLINEDQAQNVLLNYYNEWRNTGTVKLNSLTDEHEVFSRKYQAGQFAKLLNECVIK